MQPDRDGRARRPAHPCWRVGQAVRLRDHAPGGLAGRQGIVVVHLDGALPRTGRWLVRLLADPWVEPTTVEMFGDELAPDRIEEMPLTPCQASSA